MTEKRFIWKCDDENCQIYDTKKKKVYFNVEVVDLLNEKESIIQRLELENENLRKQLKSSETTSDATSHYNAFLESKITTLEKKNEQLKKENNDYEKQFRIINDKIDEYIKTADTYRIPISSLKPGDELGYFNGVYQYMKKLKKDIGGIGYE